MNQKDYYEILGVDRKASQQAVRDAYRKLAFQYHPDKNRDDPSATEKMKDINEAYAVLSDPSKRREYDLLGSRYGSMAYDRFRQSHTAEDIFRGSDIDQVLEEFARMFGFRGARDIFRDSYGSRYQHFQFYRPGAFSRGFTYQPGSENRNDNPPGQAADIPFKGVIGKLLRFVVKSLTGVELPERGEDRLYTITLRPETAGAGAEVPYSYREWGRSRNLIVKVPAGIKDGQRIKLKGMGTPGKAGGEPGDLYLHVKIRKSLGQRLKSLFKGQETG